MTALGKVATGPKVYHQAVGTRGDDGRCRAVCSCGWKSRELKSPTAAAASAARHARKENAA